LHHRYIKQKLIINYSMFFRKALVLIKVASSYRKLDFQKVDIIILLLFVVALRNSMTSPESFLNTWR